MTNVRRQPTIIDRLRKLEQNSAGSKKGGVGAVGATGSRGATGTAATVAVGTTTTGTPPAVTNSGTSSAAVLNFTFPPGAPSGGLVMFAGSAEPAGWLFADGRAMSRTTYSDLFAAIGTTYGTGDGSTTFNLPNLTGKVPVGYDSAQTEFNAMGKTGGAKTVTLSTTEMPSHNHTQNSHAHTTDPHTHTQAAHDHTTGVGVAIISTTAPLVQPAAGSGGRMVTGLETMASATPTINSTTATMQSATATNTATGGGGAHNNLQPYIALRYLIKT
jgi:microcystin-dependent protein